MRDGLCSDGSYWRVFTFAVQWSRFRDGDRLVAPEPKVKPYNGTWPNTRLVMGNGAK